jgi:IclR family transcriptional regulator, KDG regulon repressor
VDSTTIKALGVIQALAFSAEPRGVAELGRQVNLTQSNTFRILNTLVSQGYVRREAESGRYALTTRMWEYGMQVIDRHPVRRVANMHMKHVFAQIKETMLISELSGADVLYLDKVEADFPVRASARVGTRAPAWRTASGRAILAFLPPEQLAEVLETAALNRKETTVLKEALDEVRSRGFAITLSGVRVGVNSVAAPIMGRGVVPLAAISVSGPEERFSSERLVELSSAVLNTATRISDSL